MSFFGFFTSGSSTKSNDLSDTDSETHEDSEDEKEDFIGTKLYSNGNKSLFSTDARSFVRKVKTWVFNRSLNEEHVKALKKEILKSETPDLMGTFKLVVSNNNLRIIDGQHRLVALSEIIESDDRKFNMI